MSTPYCIDSEKASKHYGNLIDKNQLTDENSEPCNNKNIATVESSADDFKERELANDAVQVVLSKEFVRDEVQNVLIFNHLKNYENNIMTRTLCDDNSGNGWTTCTLCNMILKNEEFKLHLEIHKIGDSVSFVQQVVSSQPIESGSNDDRNNKIFYEHTLANAHDDSSTELTNYNLNVVTDEFEQNLENHYHESLPNDAQNMVMSGTSCFDSVDDSTLGPRQINDLPLMVNNILRLLNCTYWGNIFR